MTNKKILIVGPAWVGDMVMAGALFKVLKAAWPEVQIDVLAPPWSEALISRMPEITESLCLPVKHGRLDIIKRWQIAREIKAKQYTHCYVLPNSFKSALIPFLAKIPHRIGWRGEWRYGLLNDMRVLDKKAHPLMVERFVALADKKSQARPKLIAKDPSESLSKLQLALDKPVCVLCPGAEFGVSKQWPATHYAKLASHYLKKGWQVWILGSPKDKTVAKEIQDNTKDCQDLTGKTTLGEAIDLMAKAHLVVTNDSGLMHIAAALGRPLVAVYGSTSPDFTPPLADDVTILQEQMDCSPCFKRTCPLTHHACMQKLTPEQVISAAEERACA